MLCSVLFSKIPSKSAVSEKKGLRFTDLVIFFILNAILNGHVHAVIATLSQANICHITGACTTETPQLGGEAEQQQETCGVSQRQAESQDIWHAHGEVHSPTPRKAGWRDAALSSAPVCHAASKRLCLELSYNQKERNAKHGAPLSFSWVERRGSKTCQLDSRDGTCLYSGLTSDV